jgi:hypothetical protein
MQYEEREAGMVPKGWFYLHDFTDREGEKRQLVAEGLQFIYPT